MVRLFFFTNSFEKRAFNILSAFKDFDFLLPACDLACVVSYGVSCGVSCDEACGLSFGVVICCGMWHFGYSTTFGRSI